MKTIFFSIFILFTNLTLFAQNDSVFITEIKKNAIKIDNLKNELELKEEKYVELRDAYNIDTLALRKEINKTNTKLENLEKFKKQKKEILSKSEQKDIIIVVLRDSISQLDNSIIDINNKMQKDSVDFIIKLKEEFEKGKRVSIVRIERYYNETPFDSLIILSTKKSSQRDLELVSDTSVVSKTITDLITYYSALEVLNKKFNQELVKENIATLKKVTQESELLSKLKENIEYYHEYNDGMNEMFKSLNRIDNDFTVDGLSKKIRDKKYNMVLNEISRFVFDYDFNFNDYPYISRVITEITKVKRVKSDEEVSKIVEKL